MFRSKHSPLAKGVDMKDFGYLPENVFYFDSACQTLRPQQVIEAESEYYHRYGACGERVKYAWGIKVDDAVADARKKILKLTGKSERDYAVAFTLNTTYGINLVLQQLPGKDFDRIVTSEIEHNSVFLPSITWSRAQGKERVVLPRSEDGSLPSDAKKLGRAVVILSSMSNIDGRKLGNAHTLAEDIHHNDGLLLLDGAQHFAHGIEELKDVPFDALFGSGHKMYGPSIGIIVIRKDLIRRLDHRFLGGGTVNDVRLDDFDLIDEDHELHTLLETGLQNWAGIIGLKTAVDWAADYRPQGNKPQEYEHALAVQLFEGLKKMKGLTVFNMEASPTISIYSDTVDAHKLSLYLGEQNIMCRSGYFCCHYYLKNLLKVPPLLRIALGLHNTPAQVEHFLATLDQILRNT
ncbi:MAG: aminotransferase class V-fold PLP-dependent enzyme [Candidatus Peribacteraceae bacterium]|nr:aminotransferase class V-fold PLP-dependent enzyme [Candidatus Peribacteraceae bacterium]